MRPDFDEYSTRYRHVAMQRSDGILTLRLRSDDGPLVWGAGPHEELGHCFGDVAADPGNRIVVLTGTGDRFIAALDDSWVGEMTPQKWDAIYTNGKRLLRNLLAIEVPVIGAINGPATVHAELALLSDIVVMAEHAYLSDAPHFRFGTVPGDGAHIIWPRLLGMNRGRHFLLTGARISSHEALRLGLVADVVPAEQLLPRAWEHAADLARRHDIILRNTRDALTQELKRALLDGVGPGLALEGLGAYATWPTA